VKMELPGHGCVWVVVTGRRNHRDGPRYAKGPLSVATCVAPLQLCEIVFVILN
jgi:hypothetical protein